MNYEHLDFLNLVLNEVRHLVRKEFRVVPFRGLLWEEGYYQAHLDYRSPDGQWSTTPIIAHDEEFINSRETLIGILKARIEEASDDLALFTGLTT